MTELSARALYSTYYGWCWWLPTLHSLVEQVHTRQACPIFKIGTVNQQHAAPAQTTTRKTLKWLSYLPHWWTAKLQLLRLSAASHTAYKSNPTALTPKHGQIRWGWSQRRRHRASNQQPRHSKMPPNPFCSEGGGRKSPWIRQLEQVMRGLS